MNRRRIIKALRRRAWDLRDSVHREAIQADVNQAIKCIRIIGRHRRRQAKKGVREP